MLSQVVRVASLTLIGVTTVEVLRLTVVRPSMVSVRTRSPAVGLGRQDWTIKSQPVMSYAAGTATAWTYRRPLLMSVVSVPLSVARTTTPSSAARADSAFVET